MTASKRMTPTQLSRLSRAVLEQKMVHSMSDLQDLLKEQRKQVQGVHEAFIAYNMAMEQILSELEQEREEKDAE